VDAEGVRPLLLLGNPLAGGGTCASLSEYRWLEIHDHFG
jgi:hypothetical protein